jgi:hypothetical protein
MARYPTSVRSPATVPGPGPDRPAPGAVNHADVLTDLPSKTSRVFLTPPGMAPGPSAVRDQLARRVAG